MTGNRYTLFAAISVLIVAVLFLFVLLRPSGEAQTRALVESFGAELQKVSLTAPDAASQISEHYAPYADPSLLQLWAADPSKAPGRRTSSPYPDRIEIVSVSPQGAGYIVRGTLIERASTGETGHLPVVIQIVPEEHGYRIVAYEEQRTDALGQ